MFRKLSGKVFPHLVAIVIFLTVAVLYCRPVFQNKVLYQEDVVQWQAMSHSSFQYRDAHGHFPLWTNSMFSGMPAYMIAMDARAPVPGGYFYDLLTLGLKKPASFFFLACICFYFLALVLRINPYIAIIGGLAYSYATYNPVIVAAGHDTKMQCIALIPGLIGSLILICEKKYWQGAALTALFTAVMVSFNHMQIVYYCLIVAVIMTLGYAVRWIRKGEYPRLALTVSIAVGAALTGVLSNAVTLFTTYDASFETTRGGSELSQADVQSPGGTTGTTTPPGHTDYTANGFGTNLAFAFSMYKIEPFVLWVPEMFGGSTSPDTTAKDSRAIRALRKMPSAVAGDLRSGLSYYWGGIGDMVGGPPYAGAIICTLALLGLFVLDGRHKWWILAAFSLTLVMSWGRYFSSFNDLLLKYLPMYNKFRAPSMIIVIPVFLVVLLAVLTLQRLWASDAIPQLWKRYKLAVLATAGVFVFLTLVFINADYSSQTDNQLTQRAVPAVAGAIDYTRTFVSALKEDRQSIFFDSLLRSLVLTLLAATFAGLRIKRRIKPAVFLAGMGILIFGDVINIDLKYLNGDHYQGQATYTQNFTPSPADRRIMQDTGYYRVFDLRDSGLNTLSYGAMTAYFHRSIGGYHAAKLKIYEDLIDRQLYNFPESHSVVDMLNTKYIIWPTPSGHDSVAVNKRALGPAWFVDDLRFEHSPSAIMNALTHFHPHDTAILFDSDRPRLAELTRSIGSMSAQPGNAAAVLTDYRPDDYRPDDYHPDAMPATAKPLLRDTIKLVKNENDEIVYKSEASHPRFGVFSEIYYSRGWHAWIDDREVPIFRTDYVLRGLAVPAGHHVIRFLFHPQSYYLGRQVQWMAGMILLLLVLGAILATMQDKQVIFRSCAQSSNGSAGPPSPSKDGSSPR